MSQSNTFFRGSEFPRLLVLLAILVGGSALLYAYLYDRDKGIDGGPVATVPLTPIVPDRSTEFETVEDKTSIGLRDMAAYKKLLQQAEKRTPVELDKESRRDVLSIQIWEHPNSYRGVPIHILGTVLRVMTYESKLVPSGRLYEAWMVTSDSQRNFYVCVFEDAPKGFPVGDNISERVVFNGYFLKLMKYQSGKDLGYYSSPVLIGRIGWNAPTKAPADKTPGPVKWMAVAVALMFVLSFFRWLGGLRKSFAPRSIASTLRERPTEEISPEDLAAWVQSVPQEEAEIGEDEPPRHDGKA
ncbi:hypothetical protein [Singulisphaera sp. PoT]|uniref:hypothetical protein n=1 Tax=Singulisphaera sp. PoT TaxID=3411797 RepID=UPI003BF4D592